MPIAMSAARAHSIWLEALCAVLSTSSSSAPVAGLVVEVEAEAEAERDMKDAGGGMTTCVIGGWREF